MEAKRESEPPASSSPSTDDSASDPLTYLTHDEKCLIAHYFVRRNLERHPVHDTLEKIADVCEVSLDQVKRCWARVKHLGDDFTREQALAAAVWGWEQLQPNFFF